MPLVYILRCSDGTFYVGHTDNLAEREQAHNGGFGSRYTPARRPDEVVYPESCTSRQAAVGRERQLGRSSAAHRAALISGNLALLRQLGERRSDSRQARRAAHPVPFPLPRVLAVINVLAVAVLMALSSGFVGFAIHGLRAAHNVITAQEQARATQVVQPASRRQR